MFHFLVMSEITETKETSEDNESDEAFSTDQQLTMNGATLIEQINKQKKEIEDEVG